MSNQTPQLDSSANDDTDALLTRGSESSRSVSSEGKDAPQVLVKSSNTAIAIIRVVVALLLTATAIGSAVLMYVFARSKEIQAFEEDFSDAANRFAENFISIISLRFAMTTTLASAFTAALELKENVSPSNFSFPAGRMQDLSSGLLLGSGDAKMVSWSPILRSDEERLTFEEHVSRQGELDIERCYLCGNSTRSYENYDDYATIPGIGTYTCKEIEVAGLDGAIEPQFCGLAIDVVSVSCKCIDKPIEIVGLEEIEYPEKIFSYEDSGLGPKIDQPYGHPPYAPIWEIGSAGGKKLPYLYDNYGDKPAREAIDRVLEGNVPALTEVFFRNGSVYEEFGRTQMNESSVLLVSPVYSPDGTDTVGIILAGYTWFDFFHFQDAFANTMMMLVIENSCMQQYSYLPDLADGSINMVGPGDLHDKSFSNLVKRSSYEDYETVVNFASRIPQNQSDIEYCRYRVSIYPTKDHYNSFLTLRPFLYGAMVFLAFALSAIVFGIYDHLIRQRQEIVMKSAIRTNRIVSSLFPENVRDRLFEQAQGSSGKLGRSSKVKMENFAEGNEDIGNTPIADLFPSATVMFLDIENFTVWSSERPPGSIFALLQTVFGSFDKIARQMNVFKVETVGDSFVAVCGLPKANDKHAVVMARFAAQCLEAFAQDVQRLEVSLGPGTADLKARVGLHSGPITAGVLLGLKTRFQLFGDTVNTCQRLEASSWPMHVHASKATAELLIRAGKDAWVSEREDRAVLKGKAPSATYWVNPGRKTTNSDCSSSRSNDSDVRDFQCAVVSSRASASVRTSRLIDWNVEVLFGHLQELVASRQNQSIESGVGCKLKERRGTMVIEEIDEILEMPDFDPHLASRLKQAKQIVLPSVVRKQVKEFVVAIANTYRDVPFHNFEHASHVVMSSSKLMKRIVEPDDVDYQKDDADFNIHEATYGISSDPLLLFTVVFSALIHDSDHTGLSNAELIAVNDQTAQKYGNRSVAEQNSVSLAWRILNEPRFVDFRSCIYSCQEEYNRFRKLLVNCTIATDIADKELKGLRQNRWDAAFASVDSDTSERISKRDSDRRATVIFEYIIQAADISHTMQHWQTYQKFNRRLFEERYLAWLHGHAKSDPSGGWYKGEIGFFDFYIIPLAEKLNACGVFGASYDELLTYALENRREWKAKGEAITEEHLRHCREKFGTEPSTAPRSPVSIGKALRRMEGRDSDAEPTLIYL